MIKNIKKFYDETISNDIKYILNNIKTNELGSLGPELSYYFVLSFFPFLMIVLALLNYSQLLDYNLIKDLDIMLPDEVYELTISIISEVSKGGNITFISFSSIATIWAASKGTSALIKGLNKCFNIKEKRSFIKLKLMGILFTLVLALIIILSLILLIFGELIGNIISNYFGLSNLFNTFWAYFRYIFSLFMLFITFNLMYKFAPSKKLRLKDVYIGSIFTTVTWVLISLIFSYYMNNFGNFSKLYGSIGSVIMLLIWLNISSLIIVFGAEINELIINKKINKN